MIFIYPAAISDTVDRRYLPGIIKTLELYLLHHIAEATANGEIRFYIKQNRVTGKFSQIQMECIDWDIESLGNSETLLENANILLLEATKSSIEKDIRNNSDKYDDAHKLYRARKLAQADHESQNRKQEAAQERALAEREATKMDSYRKRWEDANKQLAELIKEKHGDDVNAAKQEWEKEKIKQQEDFQIARDYEKEKTQAQREQERREWEQYRETKRREWEDEQEKKRRPAAAGGLGDLKIDTSGITDLRPTSITVSAKVTLYKHPTPISSDVTSEDRSIPIGVKIVPIIISNVDEYYNILQSDLYSNKFSAFFKSSVRSVMGYIHKWFNPALNMFLRLFTNKEEFSIWKDMLYTKKSAINASSIGTGERHPGYQKYSSAVMVLSVNDLSNEAVNFFNNPSKVAKLHKMGWNSFAIMNDPDQTMTFCSYFENGMCSKIPYSYLFHSLKASDLFQELDSLGKFTSRIVGNFKRRQIEVAESIDEANKIRSKNAKLYNEFKEIAGGGTRSSTDNE